MNSDKCEFQDHECTPSKAYPKDVANMFNEFMRVYNSFREDNGLSGSISNVHEICNAMTDKHGRICRQVKHFERNDTKSDWPEGLTESLVGYIIYSLMILNKYNLDITKGMTNELQAAADQHSDKYKTKTKGK